MTLKLTHPKGLNKESFDDLKGTALYEQMFRNRSVTNTMSNDVRAETFKQIIAFLKDNCNSFYYVVQVATYIIVYIEGDADAVNFKMKFDDAEIEVPQKPAPKQPSIAPSQIDAIKRKYEQIQKETERDFGLDFDSDHKWEFPMGPKFKL